MEHVEQQLHLLSEHGVSVFSLGMRDAHIHCQLHHPSQKPDHEHSKEEQRAE